MNKWMLLVVGRRENFLLIANVHICINHREEHKTFPSGAAMWAEYDINIDYKKAYRSSCSRSSFDTCPSEPSGS